MFIPKEQNLAIQRKKNAERFWKKKILKKIERIEAEMLGRAMGRSWKPENPSACSAVESWTSWKRSFGSAKQHS